MASITIPNFPDELRTRLERAAIQAGVSPDQEAIAILDRALPRVAPVKLPTPIVPLRGITPDEIRDAIHEGRE
jgi:plasmid stability protein